MVSELDILDALLPRSRCFELENALLVFMEGLEPRIPPPEEGIFLVELAAFGFFFRLPSLQGRIVISFLYRRAKLIMMSYCLSNDK